MHKHLNVPYDDFQSRIYVHFQYEKKMFLTIIPHKC